MLILKREPFSHCRRKGNNTCLYVQIFSWKILFHTLLHTFGHSVGHSASICVIGSMLLLRRHWWEIRNGIPR